MVTFVLVALGAAVAVGVELLEAVAIVLAVGVSRGWGDALTGAAGGALACALLAVIVGPLVLGSIPVDALRIVIGVLLLFYGLQWLRKGTLRLAGRKARSSSSREYDETLEAAQGTTDWAARAIAFKGVLLEGVEVVLIVAALASRPSGPAGALIGAAFAFVVVLGAAFALRGPIARVPETELKWGVGVLLSAFGVFFLAEGLHLEWPGGEAAVIYLVAAWAALSLAAVRVLAARSPHT